MNSDEPFWGAAGDDEDAEEDEDESKPRSRFSLGVLSKKLASVASSMGDSIARTAAAAGELIVDPELRTRSAALLAESVGKGMEKAAAGVAKGLQQGAGRIAAGPRTVQGILQKLQRRIEEQRLHALLLEQQDAPVDVQVAFQLYEDAPQELRSRLWMALLEHPELCAEYQALAAALQQQRQQTLSSSSLAAGRGTPGPAADAAAAAAATAIAAAELGAGPHKGAGAGAAGQPVLPATACTLLGDEGKQAAEGEVSHLHAGAGDPAHLPSSHAARWAARHVSGGSASPRLQQQPQPHGHHHHHHEEQQEHQQQQHRHRHQQQQHQEEEGWQMVNDQAAARKLQGQPLLAGGGQNPPYCREREGFRNVLMTAMMSIPWPLPSEYPPDCRYATLLQISVGQEDIDEVISRDIHRTFPEYPLFGFEQGQQALFNVLKAYALHDMEAAYCQGMAFVAGLLLFYVPEEPCFQIFCRLLSTSGPNLRRLYLPGLEGLKAELRKLEFLLQRFLPNLTAHLNAAGVVPVLFASQWLLTCFSCPFPVGFACRLIDVMLQENSDAILLKTAVTILAECEGDLLMQEDFEELLTFLKVEPVQWSPQRLRRVLNAAIASPITAQDLADADEAVRQGFTGSLSRAPTFSAEAEAGAPAAEEEGEAAAEAHMAADAGPEEAAAAAAVAAASAAARASHPRADESTAEVAEPVATASGAAAADDATRGASASAGESAGSSSGDTVADELAAAQQQIDDELMNMVLMLDLDLGGQGSEERYSNTLHSAVQGSSSSQPPLG